MLTKWKVSNFKSIKEETELTLGPLTIFAGANSSGKSTFIQSILLVAQTLAHKVGSRSVVLNGSLTSLGQFDDLKSNNGESDQITIKCTCRPLIEQDTAISKRSQRRPRGILYYGPRFNQFQEIACEISFDADPSSPERDLFQIQPRFFATHLSCIYRDEDIVDQKADISIRRADKIISKIEGTDATDEIDDQLRASLDYAVELDESSLREIKEDFRSAKPSGCIMKHFLPEKITYTLDTLEEDANAIVIALQDDGNRSMFIRRSMMGRDIFLSEKVLGVLREILSDTIDFDQLLKSKSRQLTLLDSDSTSLTFKEWYTQIRTLPNNKRIEIQHVLHECDALFDRIHAALKPFPENKRGTHSFLQASPPRVIMEAALHLDNFFTSSLKYLGPLRDAPKPLYPLAPAADPYDVGLRGEHTASILELHKNKKISYIPPANFKNPVIDNRTTTRTLEKAVIEWLQYLGVANAVKSQDQGKLGHALKVGLFNSDSMHDLTHVGVGVSQVLPILVMCLLADADSTLVFEQPELHLHPKVQTLLGDFFLSMALCNKQCIVETHSEYFIDRLRFRIASASPKMELNSQTKIYFVEKPAQDSSFREVIINKFGAISDWPEGFFDQSQRQAEDILKAATMKRKTIRSNNNV